MMSYVRFMFLMLSVAFRLLLSVRFTLVILYLRRRFLMLSARLTVMFSEV